MIIETGRIVSIETEGVWVDTIRKTACGSCKAEKGCGQSLISKMDGHSSYIWVLLEGRSPGNYQLGDEIRIGVPEDVVARGALIIYLTPLFILMTATTSAHLLFMNEAVTIFSGFAGLFFGGLIVRWHSWRNRHNSDLQPVIIDDRKPLYFYHPDERHQHVAN